MSICNKPNNNDRYLAIVESLEASLTRPTKDRMKELIAIHGFARYMEFYRTIGFKAQRQSDKTDFIVQQLIRHDGIINETQPTCVAIVNNAAERTRILEQYSPKLKGRVMPVLSLQSMGRGDVGEDEKPLRYVFVDDSSATIAKGKQFYQKLCDALYINHNTTIVLVD